jgi:hypothetical protein
MAVLSKRMQVYQVGDEVGKDTLLLTWCELLKRGFVNQNGGDTVTKGYAGSLGSRGERLFADLHQELPVERAAA